jgi:3D (Asp-Asp-Asp) domain-containing protein
MAKSLFGGSAALTGALLLGSLFFYPHPSIAEDLAQNKQETRRHETTGTSLPTDDAQQLALVGAEVKTPTAPVVFEVEPGPPPPATKRRATNTTAATQLFTATAYSLRGRTASGRFVTRGLIAADRRLLPLGTRVRLEAGTYSGEYLVADRGGAVRGRKIDIWVPSTSEAMRFGRRPVKLTILQPDTARQTPPTQSSASR